MTRRPSAARRRHFYAPNEVIAVYNLPWFPHQLVDTTLTELAAYYYTLGEDLLWTAPVQRQPSQSDAGFNATLSVES